MTKFVVFGLQRTGTSWIETLLDSHPDVSCLGEIFYFTQGRFPLTKPRGRRTEMSYRRHVESSPGKRLMHYIARKKLVNETLNAIYSRSGYSAIGFKLMYDQAIRFPAVLNYVHKDNVKVIHVVRTNVLKTHISLSSAKQRKLVHTTNNITLDKIYLPTTLLLRRLRTIDNQNKFWQQFFLDYGPNYLRIEYESMLYNGNEKQKELLSYLQVNHSIGLNSQLRKINPDNIEEALINYSQIQNYLANTPYEWCLD